jgi:hypothetical protein
MSCGVVGDFCHWQECRPVRRVFELGDIRFQVCLEDSASAKKNGSVQTVRSGPPL